MTDHGTSRDSLADTARKRRTRTISVLVVDPDQQEREVTRRMLADRGYHVICVGDTRAALWQMINEDVDVAFVDLSIGTPVHWFRQIVSQFRPWQRGGAHRSHPP